MRFYSLALLVLSLYHHCSTHHGRLYSHWRSARGQHPGKLVETHTEAQAERQIDYAEELVKIEDFLTRFVSDRSSRRRDPNDDEEEGEESAEEDDEDDLADGLDDLDVGEGSGRSKAKYMKVLRKVANRQSAAVTIDLNDVKEVSRSSSYESSIEADE
jgi:hypothetical protein